MKSSTGYSLLNLLIDSEGTLGIITKAMVVLQPNPKTMYTLLIPYENLNNAIETVPEIRKNINPMAVEFIEHDVIPPTEQLVGQSWPYHARVYLMIIVDGTSDAEIFETLEAIGNICLRHSAANPFTND